MWEPIIDINDFSAPLDRIVAAIFGHLEKPALGKAPDYLKERPIPGLHPSDTRMLRAIYEDAIDRNHLIWSPEEFAWKLQDLPQEAQLDSLKILEKGGYIKIEPHDPPLLLIWVFMPANGISAKPVFCSLWHCWTAFRFLDILVPSKEGRPG